MPRVASQWPQLPGISNVQIIVVEIEIDNMSIISNYN